ncbi:MAG: BatA domain-containing protein [Verrucomicrobiales bacterium]|nr:BatA domain-containing protein [Verrucomicrobiales bacterium]
MSFLGIGFLVGLAGILVPLAIHFFGRRRKVVQPWGAMRFLNEAKPTWKRRSVRLQDLLVLLLRIGAVALLAFAFARPTIKVPVPPENVHELVMIVDRSLSTELGESSGNPVSGEILDHVSRVLESVPNDTRVRVYANGAGAGLQYLTPVSEASLSSPENRDGWLSALENVKPVAGTVDWPEAVRSVHRNSNFSEPLSRQVLIIADAAKNGWPESEVWNTQGQDFSVYIDPVGINHPGRKRPNLCVENLAVDQLSLQSGKPVVLQAKISNRGEGVSKSARLYWKESEKYTVFAEEYVPSLKPGESHMATVKKTFPAAGLNAVQVEVQYANDALLNDNTSALVLDVADHVSVAVVINELPADIQDSDTRFAYWAFAAAAGDPGSITNGENHDSFFQLQWLTPDQMPEINSDKFDVVVWSVSDAAPVTTDQLQSFVANGGGLWFRCGAGLNSNAFNNAFFPHEYGLSPAGIAANDRVMEDDKTIGLRPPSHTGGGIFSEAVFQLLDELQAKRHFSLHSPVPESSEVLLEFEGGKPFLIRRKFGRGEVFLTTMDSSPGVGNLAAIIGYVPLVREILRHLATSGSAQRNFSVGENAARESLLQAARVKTPEGVWIEKDGIGEIPLARGLYWLGSATDGVPLPLSLAGSIGESDTAPLSEAELEEWAQLEAITLLRPEHSAEMKRFAAHFGTAGELEARKDNFDEREIWMWLLAGLIGFLILEVLLAHHLLSRRRATAAVG